MTILESSIIYEEAVNQTHTNSNTIKKFKVLTRQGKEGDFPAGPTEPVKRKGPDKPSEPKKVSELNVFPDNIFPVKTLSSVRFLTKRLNKTIRKTIELTKKHVKKFKRIMTRTIMPINSN